MQSLVITSAGQELMTSLIAEGATASFTKIATSEHEYSQAELESLTLLEDIKQEVAISKLERKDESTIELLTAATNEELTEGYYVKTLGLYIKDGEENEILYAVAIDDTPDYLPAFDNQAISNIIYRLNIKVSNSAQVTLEIAPEVYATALQVEELSEVVSETKEDLQEQIDSILAGGVSGASGVKEISLADYEALSEEEKNNGTAYFIPDATPTTTDGITFTVEDGILIAIYDDGEESEE